MVDVANLLISTDVEGVSDADRQLAGLERTASRTERELGQLTRTADRTGREARQAGSSATTGAQGVDRLRRSADRAEREMRQLGTTSDRTGASLGRVVAVAAAVGVSFGTLGALGRRASQAALELSRASAEVGTITGDNLLALEALERRALNLAGTFGGTAVQQVQAYYQAHSAGAQGFVAATSLVTTANRLAIGGVSDLGSAMELLAGTMNAYSEFALTATMVSDLLFVAVRNGSTTIPQLAASLANVTATAAGFNIELGTVTASVAALTAAGTPTAQATTRVRALITALQNLNEEQIRAAAGLGVVSTAPQNFIDIISELRTGLQSISDPIERANRLSAVFGSNIEALGAVQTLVGGGFDTFTRTLEDNRDALGSTAEAYRRLAESEAQQVAMVLGSLNSNVIELGESLNAILIPQFRDIGQYVALATRNLEAFVAVASVAIAAVSVRGGVFAARRIARRNVERGGAALRPQDFGTGLAGPSTEDIVRQNAELFNQVSRGTVGLGGAGLAASVGVSALVTDLGLLGTTLAALPLLSVGTSVVSLGGRLIQNNRYVRAASDAVGTYGLRLREGGRAARAFSDVLLATSLLPGGPVALGAGIAAGVAAAVLIYRNNALSTAEALEELRRAQEGLNMAITDGNSGLERAGEQQLASAITALETRRRLNELEITRLEAEVNASPGLLAGVLSSVGNFAPTVGGDPTADENERARLRLIADNRLIDAELIRVGASAGNLRDTLQAVGLPTDLTPSVVRLREAFEPINDITRDIIGRLDRIAPRDATEVALEEGRARVATLRDEVTSARSDLALIETAIATQRSRQPENLLGFDIDNTNTITEAQNRLGQARSDLRDTTEAVLGAEIRLSAQQRNETTPAVRQLIEEVETLNGLFRDGLIGGIGSFSDTLAEAFTGGFDSFRDFGDDIVADWRQTAQELVSTGLNNQFLQLLGLGGLSVGVPRSVGDVLNLRTGTGPLTGIGGFAGRSLAGAGVGGFALAAGGDAALRAGTALTAGGAGAASGITLSTVTAVALPILGLLAGGALISRIFGSRRISDVFRADIDEAGEVSARRDTVSRNLFGTRRGSNPLTASQLLQLETALDATATLVTDTAESIGLANSDLTASLSSAAGGGGLQGLVTQYTEILSGRALGDSFATLRMAGETSAEVLDRVSGAFTTFNEAAEALDFGRLTPDSFSAGITANIIRELGIRTTSADVIDLGAADRDRRRQAALNDARRQAQTIVDSQSFGNDETGNAERARLRQQEFQRQLNRLQGVVNARFDTEESELLTRIREQNTELATAGGTAVNQGFSTLFGRQSDARQIEVLGNILQETLGFIPMSNQAVVDAFTMATATINNLALPEAQRTGAGELQTELLDPATNEIIDAYLRLIGADGAQQATAVSSGQFATLAELRLAESAARNAQTTAAERLVELTEQLLTDGTRGDRDIIDALATQASDAQRRTAFGG